MRVTLTFIYDMDVVPFVYVRRHVLVIIRHLRRRFLFNSTQQFITISTSACKFKSLEFYFPLFEKGSVVEIPSSHSTTLMHLSASKL